MNIYRVDHIVLLGFVTKALNFAGMERLRYIVNNIKFVVFQVVHTKEEVENIKLFVLVKL